MRRIAIPTSAIIIFTACGGMDPDINATLDSSALHDGAPEAPTLNGPTVPLAPLVINATQPPASGAYPVGEQWVPVLGLDFENTIETQINIERLIISSHGKDADMDMEFGRINMFRRLEVCMLVDRFADPSEYMVPPPPRAQADVAGDLHFMPFMIVHPGQTLHKMVICDLSQEPVGRYDDLLAFFIAGPSYVLAADFQGEVDVQVRATNRNGELTSILVYDR